jgi:hypothetical protein
MLVCTHWHRCIDSEAFYCQLCTSRKLKRKESTADTWRTTVLRYVECIFSSEFKASSIQLSQNNTTARAGNSLDHDCVTLKEPICEHGTSSVTFNIDSIYPPPNKTMIGVISRKIIQNNYESSDNYIGNYEWNDIDDMNIAYLANGYLSFDQRLVKCDPYSSQSEKVTVKINLLDPIPDCVLQNPDYYQQFRRQVAYIYTGEEGATGWIQFFKNEVQMSPKFVGIYNQRLPSDLFVVLLLGSEVQISIQSYEYDI